MAQHVKPLAVFDRDGYFVGYVDPSMIVPVAPLDAAWLESLNEVLLAAQWAELATELTELY